MLNTSKINETLSRKFDSWVSSIEDHSVREMAKQNTIITGGCIPSMILDEEVKDFDLYFRDFTTMFEVSNYYIERFQPKCNLANKETVSLTLSVQTSKKFGQVESSENRRLKIEIDHSKHGNLSGISENGYLPQTERESQNYQMEIDDQALKANYRPIFVTTNAITLSDKVQCMVRFWGEPDAIHQNYDFAHCTNYWTSWNQRVNLRKSAMDALEARELRYTGTTKYPVSALLRVKKFIDRGWKIDEETVANIATDIQKLDLQDPKVRKEQMVGVSSSCMAFVEKEAIKLQEGMCTYQEFVNLLEAVKSTHKSKQ